MEKITQNNVGNVLVKIVPEFKGIYNEFLKDQDREKLIHILFGSYLKPFTIKTILKKKIDTLKNIGEFLSKCFQSGDNDIDNVIHVSFFEYMEKNHFEEVIPYLSEKLVTHLKQMDNKHGYFV